MAKEKVIYFCQSCGAKSTKWMGQCPSCREWTTFVEETVSTKKSKSLSLHSGSKIHAEAVKLKDIEPAGEARMTT